ncbi:hypothetical protein C8F04DRAFT_1358129 [Mycena alexandri]|uniref:Uncharacterized protein n=1 Tax=Mycena alexandri TaxID=1745969 RepID=A0AAD6SRU5_9AGAR|nr:hypothetical protein C8F04DRAFT_1358129 [Mycena alexandri]
MRKLRKLHTKISEQIPDLKDVLRSTANTPIHTISFPPAVKIIYLQQLLYIFGHNAVGEILAACRIRGSDISHRSYNDKLSLPLCPFVGPTCPHPDAAQWARQTSLRRRTSPSPLNRAFKRPLDVALAFPVPAQLRGISLPTFPAVPRAYPPPTLSDQVHIAYADHDIHLAGSRTARSAHPQVNATRTPPLAARRPDPGSGRRARRPPLDRPSTKFPSPPPYIPSPMPPWPPCPCRDPKVVEAGVGNDGVDIDAHTEEPTIRIPGAGPAAPNVPGLTLAVLPAWGEFDCGGLANPSSSHAALPSSNSESGAELSRRIPRQRLGVVHRHWWRRQRREPKRQPPEPGRPARVRPFGLRRVSGQGGVRRAPRERVGPCARARAVVVRGRRRLRGQVRMRMHVLQRMHRVVRVQRGRLQPGVASEKGQTARTRRGRLAQSGVA